MDTPVVTEPAKKAITEVKVDPSKAKPHDAGKNGTHQTPTTEKDEFVHQWGKGLRIKHIAHSICYARYNVMNRFLGLTATVVSALVSTAVIVSLSKDDNGTTGKAIAGAFSILATLLAAANTFLKLGELAAKHNVAMAAYGSLRRKLELSECYDKDIDKPFLQKLLMQWDNLEKASPAIPNGIYQTATAQANSKPNEHKAKPSFIKRLFGYK